MKNKGYGGHLVFQSEPKNLKANTRLTVQWKPSEAISETTFGYNRAAIVFVFYLVIQNICICICFCISVFVPTLIAVTPSEHNKTFIII